jgi:DNA polymerase-3 subunit epsilon
MQNFVSIDIETATSDATSICEIGMVKYLNGQVHSSAETLIRPLAGPHVDVINQSIHGITSRDLETAPLLADVWKELEDFTEGLPLVGHNVTQDITKILKTLSGQEVTPRDFFYYCTLTISRNMHEFEEASSKRLEDLAEFAGVSWDVIQRPSGFVGHGAVNDARATGDVFLEIIKVRGIPSVQLFEQLDMRAGQVKNGVVVNGNTKNKDTSWWAQVTFGPKEFEELKQQLEAEGHQIRKDHALSDKNIVLSLFPEHLSIPEFWSCVAISGATLKTSISKKVNYLVEGDDPSGKYKKGTTSKSVEARKLVEAGLPSLRIVSEEEFLELLGDEIVKAIKNA